MPNGTYGGVRGRKTRVGEKLHRFPPTRFVYSLHVGVVISWISSYLFAHETGFAKGLFFRLQL